MGIARILDSIDRQIAQLERVRTLLGGAGATRGVAWRKKRKLTPEGRKRIADAVRRRWERQRQAAAAQN